MDALKPRLTPELRQALMERPGEPLHIQDEETNKVYLIIEQGVVPTLDQQYIQSGLALARQQIADGEISTRSVADVITEAKHRHVSK